jgi:DNA helicase IV
LVNSLNPQRSRVSEQVVEREIAHEQAFVDRVHQRLEAAAVSAHALAAEGHGRARLGHEGGLVERDAMVFQAARRIAALDAAREGIVFGRLDLRGSDRRYIGRIGLRDESRESLLVDWRAPAAAVFYRATAQDPMNALRRRVLRSVGETVVSVEDELLDAEHAPADMVVVGEGALMAEISRARDRSMHSVVATIAREQDEAIRSPERGVTAISGGPGTGKTVVALHRVAYLLYTDRRRFESGGVLVIGPSPVFMHYIERVLPSLGETAVTLRSLGDVVDGVSGVEHDAPEVLAIKGSARMRYVLASAARDFVPGSPDHFRVFYRDDVLTLDPHSLGRVRRQLLANGQRRNRALPRVQQALIDALWSQARGERARARGRDEFVNEMLGSDEFMDFVARWWPPVDGAAVLSWLADPVRLRRYARRRLSDAECALLVKSWTDRPDWSVEDIPLIDELRYLIGDVPVLQQRYDPLGDLADDEVHEVSTVADRQLEAHAKPSQRIEDDGFAHVLVDEAQDLSPMQWRMVGRRGRYASWTIVGDAAQSAWPAPPEAEAARAEALKGKPLHSFRLSVNYRNSKEIFDLAAQVARLAVEAPDLPEAVRATGNEPLQLVAEEDALGREVFSQVRALLDVVDGTIGVVVPVARWTESRQWVDGLDRSRVSILDGLEVKGLEFDAVVVVQPGEIGAESPAGWRTLYVALSRATKRLVTVSTERDWMAGAASAGREDVTR